MRAALGYHPEAAMADQAGLLNLLERLLLLPERAAPWALAQRPDLHDRRAQLELIEAGPPAEGQELVVLQHYPIHPLTDAVPAPIN